MVVTGVTSPRPRTTRREIDRVSAVKGRLVLNSEAEFTIEVEVGLANGVSAATAAPLGTTVGMHDVPTAPLDDAKAFMAKLRDALIGCDANNQRLADELMTSALATADGAMYASNFTCAASMAICSAASAARRVPLWQHIGEVLRTHPSMPGIAVNVLNGGAHNATGSSVTEAMVISPPDEPSMMISRVVAAFGSLREDAARTYGSQALASGIEGGVTAPVQNSSEAYKLIERAVDRTDRQGLLRIGFDMAANSLRVVQSPERYQLDATVFSARELAEIYQRWYVEWPLFTYLEDPFADNDPEAWTFLAERIAGIGSRLIVADDLLATRTSRLNEWIGHEPADGVIAKINQCGTVTLAADFIRAARACGLVVIVSQRSRETDSSFLTDFAVGVGANYLKAGCCARERICKYNRLLRIGGDLI